MTDQHHQASDWNHCETGLLSGYAKRMQRRQLLLLAARTGGGAACMAAAGFGGWFLYMQQLELSRQLAGVTCADVRELMPVYRLKKLDKQRSKLLEEHVRRCWNCAKFHSELRSES